MDNANTYGYQVSLQLRGKAGNRICVAIDNSLESAKARARSFHQSGGRAVKLNRITSADMLDKCTSDLDFMVAKFGTQYER